MSSDIFKKSWPYTAIIIAHLIWGANFVVAKLTLQEFPPMSLAFLRFLLATVLLLPFVLIERDKMKVDREDLPALFSIGALMVTLNIAFFYAGLARTTATSASILTMIIPVLSILLSWIFLKEKIFTVNLIGIGTGLLGTVLIIGFPLLILGEQLSPQVLIGNFLIILASIVWVIGAIISKKMLQKYSTLTITAIIFLVGVLTFAIPAVNEYIQNPLWINQVTPVGIFGLLFIAILSSVSAYFLFEWGLGRLGVIKADIFQYIEPIIATALAVVVLGEKLQTSFLIGASFIALGVYWSTLAKVHHSHHKAHRV
ncbi:MAG: EamA family transporter [bacterium]|nr:EamA family transporter [bacterium]